MNDKEYHTYGQQQEIQLRSVLVLIETGPHIKRKPPKPCQLVQLSPEPINEENEGEIHEKGSDLRLDFLPRKNPRSTSNQGTRLRKDDYARTVHAIRTHRDYSCEVDESERAPHHQDFLVESHSLR